MPLWSMAGRPSATRLRLTLVTKRRSCRCRRCDGMACASTCSKLVSASSAAQNAGMCLAVSSVPRPRDRTTYATRQATHECPSISMALPLSASSGWLKRNATRVSSAPQLWVTSGTWWDVPSKVLVMAGQRHSPAERSKSPNRSVRNSYGRMKRRHGMVKKSATFCSQGLPRSTCRRSARRSACRQNPTSKTAAASSCLWAVRSARRTMGSAVRCAVDLCWPSAVRRTWRKFSAWTRGSW